MVQAYENSSKTLASNRKEFGSDMNASTTTESVAIKYNTPSEPLFITYIKDDEDTFYEEPEYNSVSKEIILRSIFELERYYWNPEHT